MERHIAITYLAYLLTIIISNIGCSSLQEDYLKMIGQKINLDGISIMPKTKLKVVNYQDKAGCTTCRMQPAKWEAFIKSIDTIASIQIILVVESDSIGIKFPRLPIYHDAAGKFNKLNHFPADERFHCFLLDEDNRVILIGNPVQSPKIKELYIRTICERLGIEQPTASDGKAYNTRNLGKFPYTEAKETEFQLRNNSEGTVNIDTVYTSCSCTTASLNKTTIEPGGFAQLKVRYQADSPGTFMREVYVGFGGQTITFTIRGEAME